MSNLAIKPKNGGQSLNPTANSHSCRSFPDNQLLGVTACIYANIKHKLAIDELDFKLLKSCIHGSDTTASVTGNKPVLYQFMVFGEQVRKQVKNM